MERFRKLGIIEPIIRTIEEQMFEKPSEIQEKAIPPILAGKDVIAGSATGSGKTLVFGSQIIHKVEKGKGIQALILTPTRELAEQESKALQKFSKYKPLNIVAIYGGLSINPQITELRHADVVVATPGRIIDHLKRRTINFDFLKILVLDEADRMLDMGFIDHVEQIINQCPRKRQTLLFSATISKDVSHLAKKYMKEPVEVAAESYVDPKKLAQFYYDSPDNLKFSLLVHLLKHEKSGLVMVFCNTRSNTDFVVNNLRASGVDALAVHGGFSQEKRSKTMSQFNEKKVYVLVCTDVAARGLDIKGVSHVYNYDTPRDSKEYIHRIGRTARAGKEGKAISLLTSRDYDNFSRVLRDNEVTITKEEMPNVEQVMVRWMGNKRFGSSGSSRGFDRGGRGRDNRESRYGNRQSRDSYRSRSQHNHEDRDNDSRGSKRSEHRNYRSDNREHRSFGRSRGYR